MRILKKIIENTEASDTIPSLESLPKDAKVELMTNLVLMMKIDGRIDKEEMKFCLKVLRKLGYDEDALFDLVSTTYIEKDADVNKEDIKKRAQKYLD